MESLLEAIAALESRKDALQRELESIDIELESHRRAYARIANNKAAIFRLPNELLTDILAICQKSLSKAKTWKKSRDRKPFHVAISHVCHRWREIVLGTPLFWNTIDMAGPIQLSFLEARLTRSESCFLDITLDFHTDAIQPYLDLLKLHCERWRRLSLVSRRGSVDPVRALLQDATTPLLEHLSLSIVETPQERSLSPRQQYNDVLPSILPSASERLKFVRLAGLSLGNHHPPTSSVTTLHLDGWTRHYMTHKQFQHILQSPASLVNLSLNELSIHFPRDPMEIISPVNLPHLVNLRIRGSCSPIARPLALMNMPNLHSLFLVEILAFNSDDIPSVRALSLESCQIYNESEVEGLCIAFPHLTSLYIDGGSVLFIFSMLSLDLECWPRLDTIGLRRLNTLEVPHFCVMVFDLDENNRGLRNVFLDRCSRQVLRKQHRLDWLQNLVPNVENRDEPEAWPLDLGYEDTHDILYDDTHDRLEI